MLSKNLLALLGGSAALVLAPSSQAQELVFTAANEPIPEQFSEFDCSCSEDSSAAKALDAEGDKAISLYGCDCAGCRFLSLTTTPEEILR